jgi:hypothetical protein
VRRIFGRLLLIGALAGGAVAARNYLRTNAAGEDVVDLVFDDNSTKALPSNTPEAQEFTDIARKVIEIGV